jgi:hypothetical protein
MSILEKGNSDSKPKGVCSASSDILKDFRELFEADARGG